MIGLLLNLAGVSSVGGVSTALSFMTLVPFAIYVGCGFASGNVSTYSRYEFVPLILLRVRSLMPPDGFKPIWTQKQRWTSRCTLACWYGARVPTSIPVRWQHTRAAAQHVSDM